MYSNCLIEAIKAKIKDPKNVQIIKLPKEVNGRKSHFMWVKENFVYHAFNNQFDNRKFWFPYSVKKVPVDVFE